MWIGGFPETGNRFLQRRVSRIFVDNPRRSLKNTDAEAITPLTPTGTMPLAYRLLP
jgi:hypothetical protein